MFRYIIIVFLSVSLYAVNYPEKQMMDMVKTYGFYMGQSYTLNQISKKYPQLNNQIS